MKPAPRPKLLHVLPVDSQPVYLRTNEQGYEVLYFLRVDSAGNKQRHTGGEICLGDIVVIKRNGKPVEVVLNIESIITELPIDPTPKQKLRSRRRA